MKNYLLLSLAAVSIGVIAFTTRCTHTDSLSENARRHESVSRLSHVGLVAGGSVEMMSAAVRVMTPEQLVTFQSNATSAYQAIFTNCIDAASYRDVAYRTDSADMISRSSILMAGIAIDTLTPEQIRKLRPTLDQIEHRLGVRPPSSH